jgi:putative transposase
VVTTHNAPAGFRVHPRRRVVERTFAWFVTYRRLARGYDVRAETSEAMIYAAMTHRMVRRLRPAA